MKNRELLRCAALSIGLVLTLTPALANANPGDLVDPSFKPRVERDDATVQTIPIFPSLRIIFDGHFIGPGLILPRISLGKDARDVIGRILRPHRRNFDSTGAWVRPRTGLSYRALAWRLR